MRRNDFAAGIPSSNAPIRSLTTLTFLIYNMTLSPIVYGNEQLLHVCLILASVDNFY